MILYSEKQYLIKTDDILYFNNTNNTIFKVLVIKILTTK